MGLMFCAWPLWIHLSGLWRRALDFPGLRSRTPSASPSLYTSSFCPITTSHTSYHYYANDTHLLFPSSLQPSDWGVHIMLDVSQLSPMRPREDWVTLYRGKGLPCAQPLNYESIATSFPHLGLCFQKTIIQSSPNDTGLRSKDFPIRPFLYFLCWLAVTCQVLMHLSAAPGLLCWSVLLLS